MGEVGLYRASVNLPGLPAGETARLDPSSLDYLKRWVDGEYLVLVDESAEPKGRRRRDGDG